MVYIVAHTVLLLQSESDDEGDDVSHVGNRQVSIVWTAILLCATFAKNNGTSTLRESITEPR